ncbi:adhesion G-protein coupled receptor F1-like [Corythoichthys intestinalis]|uniref:adhesion G-protein coupled receptor F1-like n=1 Tax=Corythoichthys intestinalis TaxID=161448 RepID=UPI0025A56587|nr:adhesion G-protein coupled receptor F1-like [Corythoichthys intestinalis]
MYHQAYAVGTAYIAEVLMESNATLQVDQILSALNNATNLRKVTLHDIELMAECVIVGNEYSCNCSDGYIWSYEVCQDLRCCNENSCKHNVLTFTSVCIAKDKFTCIDDPEFGYGFLNDIGRASCRQNEVGEKTAICRASGEWEDRDDNCTLETIFHLLSRLEILNETTLPEILAKLRNETVTLSQQVIESPNNINATVRILDIVATFVRTSQILINQTHIENVLYTTSVLTMDNATASWDALNSQAVIETFGQRTLTPRNNSLSSLLLFSLESMTSRLNNASFNIETPLIILNKTTFTDSFKEDFNSTVEIDIQWSKRAANLTVITFESLHNVLPPRDENKASGRVINGRVVLVQSDSNIDNISFSFDVLNENLTRPQCVFWNFALFEGLGGWDDKGCELVRENETVTCQCDHMTSFSILTSPNSPNNPLLDDITYIGLGISMLSLVICLCIEALIWRKVSKCNTSYFRHISIVNIALSLLTANICFIIGAGIAERKEFFNLQACTAMTFFTHLLYLALFFWMFNYGLLVLYYTVNVFEAISKSTMLAIGFCLGYGAPLIIAMITIVVTAPVNEYIRETPKCWLNWNKSRAMLAFVNPALLIVFINILILIVVMVKLLQRRGMPSTVQGDEKNVVGVLARTMAILTPFLGLTWCLGVGTLVDPDSRTLKTMFDLFNSLQGLFILIFGMLLDKKVRAEIWNLVSQTSVSGTKPIGSSNSSSQWWFWKTFGRKGSHDLPSTASKSSCAAICR